MNMFVPTELTYVEAVVAVIGLFIAGYMARKKQAAKRYQKQQQQQQKDKQTPPGV